MCNTWVHLPEIAVTALGGIISGTWRRNRKTWRRRVNLGITLCGAFELDDITWGSQ